MNHGKIEQKGTPWSLYESPANKFVAEFMGESNLLEAKVIEPPIEKGNGVAALANGACVEFVTDKPVNAEDEIVISIRPEHVTISSTQTEGSIEGTIEETIYLGEATRHMVRLKNSGSSIISKQTRIMHAELEGIRNQEKVFVSWESSAGVVLTK